MKIKTLLAVTLASALIAAPALAKDKLEAQAKISKADAEKIALAKVPGGKVKEAELEEEDGKLIWTFDIAKEGSKDIVEVNVDAKTGEVVSVEEESAEREAAEKAKEEKEKSEKKDKKEAKEKKGDKDDDEKEEKK